ncbi:serine/threonine-protein kinase AGC1-5 [Andrographis paniculata]|uniref:serine/threonine-protein kinase AGC1-5 n=1 Tax=Andrographis paniculata TaxID=175694 RepID=UPI0021E992D9|nr:serine/threonine-protein kinase AGC1-5 [Andrographis paniculata]
MESPVDNVADELESLSFNSTTTTTATDIHRSISSGSDWTSSSSAHFPPSAARQYLTTGDHRWDAVRRFASISFSDLRFLHRLGAGDIGSVYLAELKPQPFLASADSTKPNPPASAALFAAKVMDKRELASRNKEGRARTEKEILEVLDHPFLPTLYAAIDSPKWSCLLTEFCPGGDLHVLRQRQPSKRFSDAAVRFYAAEVVAALEYIHMMGIVYRDLKPENVLIRSDGHIMLTDFDLSLRCDDSTSTPAQVITGSSAPQLPPQFPASSCILPNCIVPAVSCFHHRRRRRKKADAHARPAFVAEPIDVRSMSFVGTHEYLAPEIISGEGHGSAVDWWTLGIFVFELFYGTTPFRGTDHEMTLANIVARALELPKDPGVPGPAKDLIAQLLVKDPARRLGSTLGAAAIKQHPFFQGVNWALLRCAPPPFKPPPFARSGVVSGESGPDQNTTVEYY